MPRRYRDDDEDDRPRRPRPRKKRVGIHWAVPLLIAVGVLGVVGFGVLYAVRGNSLFGGGGAKTPTEAVQKLVQAAEWKDWSAAFDLIEPEAQQRVTDGMRGYIRSLEQYRHEADNSNRWVFARMCQHGLDWPRGVSPKSAVVGGQVDGDRAVVTVETDGKPHKVMCVKVGKRWYLTDR